MRGRGWRGRPPNPATTSRQCLIREWRDPHCCDPDTVFPALDVRPHHSDRIGSRSGTPRRLSQIELSRHTHRQCDARPAIRPFPFLFGGLAGKLAMPRGGTLRGFESGPTDRNKRPDRDRLSSRFPNSGAPCRCGREPCRPSTSRSTQRPLKVRRARSPSIAGRLQRCSLCSVPRRPR